MSAIVLETVARNAMANGLVDLIDAGGGAGYMTITTSGDVVLATLTFSATAFGAAASGVATAASITGDTSADATGTAAKVKVYDFADTLIFTGDVSTAAAGTGDLQLVTTSITAGQAVDVTSFTVTAPAS